MADSAPTVPDKVAESPTTARPIDFDDEQQETGIIQPDGTATANVEPPTSPTRAQNRVRFEQEEEEAPPPKPPRPMSPKAQREADEAVLTEAFPSIDGKVVRAVLTASGGNVESAFNALLGMSDPDYQEEEVAPPQPPRPTADQRQLQQDEMYARQLAEHYNTAPGTYGPRSSSLPQAPRQTDPNKEYSFFDDDLPEIRENLRQGFIQTQTKVNQWISDFRKKIDGDEDDDYPVTGQGSAAQRQNYGPSQSDQLHGIQRNAAATRARRSADYDDDPQVLSSNFTELELRDNEEEEAPPRKPARPQANPNLFKPTPPGPQSGPVDEVDALYGHPTQLNRQPSPGTGGKSKKWQPLTSVAPNPDADDNDPFSLGDSDDDKEAKSKDIRAEDTERLKQSASEVVADAGVQNGLSLGPAERSGSMGTRNKEAEELMK